MPMDIVVLESSGVLNITWDHVFENCPLYRYHIQATDSCGDCPPFTRDAMVFCTDVADISMCFINISVEVCGMSGPVGTGEVSTSFISSPTSSTPSNGMNLSVSTQYNFYQYPVINPWRMHEDYGSRSVCECECVCLSVTSLAATCLIYMSKMRHHRVLIGF